MMKINIFELRETFQLHDYRTSITREDFEKHFKKTKESIRFTFGGWDGKSYDGESRNAKVYYLNREGYEKLKFVKVGKRLHYIEEDNMVIEKATGEEHPRAGWFLNVQRQA